MARRWVGGHINQDECQCVLRGGVSGWEAEGSSFKQESLQRGATQFCAPEPHSQKISWIPFVRFVRYMLREMIRRLDID